MTNHATTQQPKHNTATSGTGPHDKPTPLIDCKGWKPNPAHVAWLLPTFNVQLMWLAVVNPHPTKTTTLDQTTTLVPNPGPHHNKQEHRFPHDK